MKQHEKTLTERPLDAWMVTTALLYMHRTGVPLTGIIDSVEAGVAEFLKGQGINPAIATDQDEIAVTMLVCGEIATDILPHLQAAKVA